MKKIIRISTVPISLDLLLKGQLEMLSNEYEVIAISSPGKELETVAKREKVRTIAVPMERKISILKDFVSLIKLICIFKNEKPYIVHSLTPKAGLLAMVAAWICNIPIRIHTFTGLVFPTAKGIKQKLLITTDRITCKCATFINPEGEGVKKDLQRFGITSKPLKIIGNGNINGINAELFSRTNEVMQKTKKIIKPDKLTFCFVGRITGEKGINELIEAFNELHTKHSHIRLMLVGNYEEKSDPLKPETIQIISVHPDIIHTGWQNDIRPYLAASDIFVFPSYREGFPNAVMQAGAMGLPSIVTDINGCNEIIKENVNGIIIKPHNKNMLKNAMEEMITNKNLRINLAQNARCCIIPKYEQKKLWKEILTTYRSLIKDKNKTTSEYTTTT